ncbi:TetR/AcrR family transcriptional regulator [Georgenia sp. H159]|uniref:TetR/AcrR family transcriptional regulator n=1 Tax=Georgenia sp. H159 TaxID=3076115 RepID=UPI002D79809F|nr:TetR/AcrR family transcriptional regulator [Georgenia sp. H159]
MPKISAATVAEHRAARERALLDAAHAILLETGEPPRLADVAARAGLARTSAYQYFGSQFDLLKAMVQDVYPQWTKRIRGAMAAAPTDADRILAYAVANVELVDEGAHAVGSALAALDPDAALDEEAVRMHREVQEPLIAALTALDVDAPADVAGLVNAVVHGATLLLEAGQGLDAALARLNTVLGPLVRELGGTGRIE